jgi:hypothetical protein
VVAGGKKQEKLRESQPRGGATDSPDGDRSFHPMEM